MLKRWIEFQTTDNNWLIDLEFLLSNYQCSWGTTCKGINTDRPDLGCCANGAYLGDGDEELLASKVPLLTSWQRAGRDYLETVVEEWEDEDGTQNREESVKTALADPEDSVSGCVFANDPDYEGGAGCALHIEAMKRGEDFRDWKPAICWQMPLVMEYIEELETHIVRMFNWTKEDYPWFCGQDELTWVAEQPLYQTMAVELKKMCEQDWDDPMAYDKIKEICDQAFAQSAQWRGEKAFIRPVPVTLQQIS